jgi:acetyl esterase/lipase
MMIFENEILLQPQLPDRRNEETQRDVYNDGLKDIFIENVHNPSLVPYLAPQPCGTAVVVCPGGGYEILSWVKEGVEVAQWLNSFGVSAFVLKYRLKAYGHPHTLNDALAAIEYVRNNAAGYNIDPARIGILGFSAGGHLAASASVHFQPQSRPDFSVLIYPVISMIEPYGHGGSMKNLFGQNSYDNLADYYSAERQVKDNTPPAFLAHTSDDAAVDVQNSIAYYQALRRKGIEAEMHIYNHGPHGFGLRDSICTAAGDWPQRCGKWITGVFERG